MGILSTMFAAEPAQPAPSDDFWYQDIGKPTAAGTKITPDTAMQISAVHACVRILAETVGSLPLIVYQRMPDGSKERATKHPLYSLLHDSPNERQTAMEWREMMQGHLALRGNAYSEIIPGPRGLVDQLLPLHPNQVTVQILTNGAVRYQVRKPDGSTRILRDDQIFHIRGLSSNGYVGLSPITMAREAMGLSLAAEQFGARFFGNSARPSGVLTTDKKLDSEQQTKLKAQWRSSFGGENAHRAPVLPPGIKWEQISVTPNDGQFLETRNFQVEDIARIYRIPLVLLQRQDKSSTYASAEQFFLSFVKYTMLPWFMRWTQATNKRLILAKSIYFVEFMVEDLLRGDIVSRYKAYSVARQWGWLSVNDIRKKENMNPVDGGDEYITPANMHPAGQAPDSRAQALAYKAAERVVRKELRAVEAAAERHAGDPDGLQAWAQGFYEEHTKFAAACLATDPAKLAPIMTASAELVQQANGQLSDVLSAWEQHKPAQLAALAVE